MQLESAAGGGWFSAKTNPDQQEIHPEGLPAEFDRRSLLIELSS